MDAIILAGGKGTRLGGVTGGRPKALVPVAGKPFLDHLIDFLRDGGVAGNIIIAAGYGASQIRDWAQGAAENITVVEEETPLGTGGAMLFALDKAAGTDTVLVMNGDSLTRLDLAAMAQAHRTSGCPMTMAVTGMPDTSRYGEAQLAQGRVTALLEKNAARRAGTINAGIYMAEKKAFAHMPRGASSLERDIIPGLIAAGINAFCAAGPFIDIGTPESYAAADAFFADEEIILQHSTFR